MHQAIRLLLLSFIPFVFPNAFGQTEEEDNSVHIYGYRKEEKDADLPGQGKTLSPDLATRKDLSTLLSTDTSVDFIETGRISGSGFSVPRLRGQDTRATEVWIDDFLVQDPLTGLPLIDDLDLVAFGTVKLFRGITPLAIHTAHQRGTIQFAPDFGAKGFNRSVGVSVGKPYGTSGYGLVQGNGGSEGKSYRIYGRNHSTRGDYKYYNDYATPYNSTDDQISTRKNNHRHSSFLAPILRIRSGNGVFKLLPIFSRSMGGIPTRNPHLESYAEEEQEQALVNGSWQYSLAPTSPLLPTRFSAGGQLGKGFSRIKNQDDRQFGFSGDREIARKSAASNGTLSWDLQNGSCELAASAQSTQLSLDDTKGPALQAVRSARTFFGGVDFMLPSDFRFFQKADFKSNTDRVSDDWTEDKFADKKSDSKSALSWLSAAAWSPGSLHAYIQYGMSKRMPALIETFGDSGRIRPNPSLEPEKETHHEAGLSIRDGEDQLRGSVSWFQDKTHEKIVFLPSISETSRAANLKHTLITGLELTSGWEGNWLELSANWTTLSAKDRSAPEEEKRIPGIAEKQGTLSVLFKWQQFQVRNQARYRGNIYRDNDNTVLQPASTLFDLFIDYRSKQRPNRWTSGLSVINLTNVIAAPVQAYENPDGSGKTAVSDVSGYPLPGRQIKLTLEKSY